MSSIKLAEKRDCKFCNERTDISTTFYGSASGLWKYLDIGEMAHPECYIHKCVRESFIMNNCGKNMETRHIEASDYLKKFFKKLLDLKQYVAEKCDEKDDPILEEIYSKLHQIIKEEQ